jgi:hypothetical protein
MAGTDPMMSRDEGEFDLEEPIVEDEALEDLEVLEDLDDDLEDEDWADLDEPVELEFDEDEWDGEVADALDLYVTDDEDEAVGW